MRFTSLFVTTLLTLYATAAPATSYDSNEIAYSYEDKSTIKARGVALAPIPTIEEIKKHLPPPANMTGLSLFYSGPGGYKEKARARALTFKPHRRILEDLWLDPKYPDPWKDVKEFWNRASKALAEDSSGVAYVLLPNDTNSTEWFQGTIWDRVEWPTILLNINVTRVIRINPDNNNEEVIVIR